MGSTPGPSPDIERYRKVLEMRRAGATFTEIGRALGTTATNAHHVFVRAQARLESPEPLTPAQALADAARKLDAAAVELQNFIAEARGAISSLPSTLSSPLPSPAAEDERPGRGRKKRPEPPDSLWTYIVIETTNELGVSGVAKYCRTDDASVTAWRVGERIPSEKYRSKLRELAALIWGSSIFVDDDGEFNAHAMDRARDRAFTYKNTVRDR